jgi:Ca-activated chloride channel family protein
MVSRLLVWIAVLVMPVPALAQPVFRTGVDLVNLGVTVVDRRGALVTDLQPDDFEVLEDGRPQQIDYFIRGDEMDAVRPPMRVGLLFDTSGSMIEHVGFSRSAAIKFLNTLDRATDMTLVDFDSEVRVTLYSPADFPHLVQRIRNRKPEGWTALYDALGVYLDGASDRDGQKILVLYNDGGDTRSAMSFGDVLAMLRASDVTLYVIGFLERQSASTRHEQRLRLLQLAEATGGQAFFPTSVQQLDAMYGKVLEEIDARYTLGFVPPGDRANGSWRELKIRVTRPDLKGAKVRSRKGYFAPGSRMASQP